MSPESEQEDDDPHFIPDTRLIRRFVNWIEGFDKQHAANWFPFPNSEIWPIGVVKAVLVRMGLPNRNASLPS